MNWGWKIFIGYTGFMAMILALVFLSSAQTFHLVTPNYYEKEQSWDDRMERVKNTQQLEDGVSIQYQPTKSAIVIQFPKSLPEPSGKIELYRPVDARQDLTFDIVVDEVHSQLIHAEKLSKGVWRIHISWEAEEVPYYSEQVLVIP